MTRRRHPAWLVLIFAICCGSIAGYAALHLLERQPAALPGPRFQVEAMESAGTGFRLQLDNGRALYFDTIGNAANARNMALLYPGKMVGIVSESRAEVESGKMEPCTRIVPLLEERPQPISLDRYRQMAAAGFSDAELAYSYAIPGGEVNPNEAPAMQDVPLYMNLSICARDSR